MERDKEVLTSNDAMRVLQRTDPLLFQRSADHTGCDAYLKIQGFRLPVLGGRITGLFPNGFVDGSNKRYSEYVGWLCENENRILSHDIVLITSRYCTTYRAVQTTRRKISTVPCMKTEVTPAHGYLYCTRCGTQVPVPG